MCTICYGWYQKKCPIFNFFKGEVVPELCKACGDIDERIAELFPDQKEIPICLTVKSEPE